MQEQNSSEIFQNRNTTANQTSCTAETNSQHPMDPFHRNYTLTGLVNHIQVTLNELISKKKAPENIEQLSTQWQMDKLLKIQQEISVLKNIIVFNLNQIFNNLYPSSLNLKEEPKTNDRHTVNREEKADQSPAIMEFEPENGEKYGKINHLEVKNDRARYYQSKESKATEDLETKSQALSASNHYKQIQRNREMTKITPFLLQDANNNIKVEDQDCQQADEDGFDLLCYEDQKSIQGYRGIRAKEAQEKGFSPIAQRAAEQQETAQKGMLNKGNITFNNFRPVVVPSSHHSKSVDITRRLFSYTSVVLPKRLSRRKFNYLQQISERRR